MRVKAYAKINLALKVKGVLENGYHELQMLNAKISLYDLIVIKKAKKDFFSMNKMLCKKEDNIAYKAYCLLKEKYDIENNYYIHIKKNIPCGAGLAGGSADAAAVINAIIQLENLKIKSEELVQLALKLGADVPYCLQNEICVVEGIGEKITPINIEKKYQFILGSPDVSISTKNIFTNYKQNDCDRDFDAILANNSINIKKIFNDLENVAKTQYPEYQLDLYKERFYNYGAVMSLMTGSGSSVIAIFENKKLMNNCSKHIRKEFPCVKFKKCKTISY